MAKEEAVCKITVNNKEYTYPKGTSYLEIAADFQKDYDQPILLLTEGRRLRELHHTLKKDVRIEFLTARDAAGHLTYQRTCSMIFLSAVYHIGGYDKIRKIDLHFSLDAGYFYTVEGDVRVDADFCKAVEANMREIVDRALPITKRSLPTAEAVELFKKYRMADKVKLFRTRLGSTVNLYKLGEYEDYYYGYMAPNSGLIRHFALIPYQDGIILQMPKQDQPDVVPPFQPLNKLYGAQRMGESWAEKIGVPTIGDFNARIISQSTRETILLAEALQDSRLAEIADEIVERKGVKFVMIAGPSSSGKTTFSQRLCIHLQTRGLMPHYIGVDNYFVDRDKTPLDEEGKKDYECLEAIDVAGFQADMKALLAGETVPMPTYDFIEGKRVYKGNTITLGSEDLLVIEGIHCLNDDLSCDLPIESKYKIYISAMTQLNVDEHNRIPTTDGRLLRRMVRDNRTRGYDAAHTIAMWPSVRRGEEKHIFPHQETADAVFNSALPYELAVLKLYAQPLLFQVADTDPAYPEARRLLKFLDYIIAIPSEDIPQDSLIREFIGGGCYQL